jgi:hypothetical protein
MHQRMGHLNMSTIQELAKQDFLVLLPNSSKVVKYHCVRLVNMPNSIHPQSLPTLQQVSLMPYIFIQETVFWEIDQIESSSPGLIPTYRGTPVNTRYHAGTLFVYFASRFLYFMPHISTGASEAINAKHSFELLASQHNMLIKCYHTDNGIFASTAFHNSCKQQNQ